MLACEANTSRIVCYSHGIADSAVGRDAARPIDDALALKETLLSNLTAGSETLPDRWLPGSLIRQIMMKFITWSGGAKPFHGQTTYFLSHAWSYKLGDLWEMVS